MRILGKVAATALMLAALGALGGCRGNSVASQVAAMNDANIKRVANMYAAFQNFKGNRGPADAAEFKGFIQEFDPNKLAMMGIDKGNLDATFTSERDGKPFLVRYKVGGGRGSVDPVVFEQEGKDGKKQVGYTGGKVEEVDDATAKHLYAGKTPHPGSAEATAGRPPMSRPAGAPTGPEKK